MITVHHLNNSRSQRVLWLLEELELPYEIVKYQRDPQTMLAPPELKKIHPLGKSPVVIDGDAVLEARVAAAGGGESARAGEIDGEHDGELALFDEALDERLARAGGHVPVDGAHVVARLVLAHVGELDAAALEGRVVLSGEQPLHPPRTLQRHERPRQLIRLESYPPEIPSRAESAVVAVPLAGRSEQGL